MLKTAGTEVITPNLITTAIRSNHFNHSHFQLSLSLLPYIYALPVPKSKIFFGSIFSDKTPLCQYGRLVKIANMAWVVCLFCKKYHIFSRNPLILKGLQLGSLNPPTEVRFCHFGICHFGSFLRFFCSKLLCSKGLRQIISQQS
jgi:hypothetical protein